jgi:hypothetical protein
VPFVPWKHLAAVAVAVATVLPALPAAPASAAAPQLAQAWSHTYAGGYLKSSPTVADVDGDGVPEIVLGGRDGWVRVFRANGEDLPGWPRAATTDGVHPSAIDGAVTVADLDNDGAVELIVPTGSNSHPDDVGGIVVFRRDGSVRWRWTAGDEISVWRGAGPGDGIPDGVISTPAIGDVDGDGRMDIVFGAWDLRIHALNRDGHELSGFPVWNDDTVWSSPALYDVDGDGRQEIFIGGDSTAGGPEDWAGGVLRALDWRGGTVVELWKRRPTEVVGGSPAIGDINGDGRREVVVSTARNYNTGDSRRVFAWHVDDGSDVPGWPVQVSGAVIGSPALGDLNGDGVDEVVFGDQAGWVHAFRGNGSELWGTQPQQTGEGGGLIDGHATIADLDGDGDQDVVIANGWGTFLLRGTDGGRLYAPVSAGWSAQNQTAVGTFPGGRLLVTASAVGSQGYVAAYHLPASNAVPEWPMWRLNARHLGTPPSDGTPLPPGMCSTGSNPAGTPVPNSGSGYWVLRRNGVVEAFHSPHLGNAALAPGSTAVGMAARPQGDGYWVVGSDGAVFGMGAAGWLGAPNALGAGGRAVNIAPTPSGGGYWVIMADGRVFAFGDADHHGDPSSMALNQPVIALASTPSGNGYWVLALDGGIFSYGDAAFYGSTGNLQLNAPVISLSSTASGHGYWLMARDGGIFSFGDAQFRGSAPGTGLCAYPDAVQIRRTLTGGGYWTLMVDNGVFSYGDANFFGANPDASGTNPPVDLVIRN